MKNDRIWVSVAPYAIVKFIEALHNSGVHNIGVSQEDDTLCVSWLCGQHSTDKDNEPLDNGEYPHTLNIK